MGAFNIPPTMMNLTLLIGIGGVGLALLIAVIWSLVPLPVAIVSRAQADESSDAPLGLLLAVNQL